jgi:ABC-type transport system involved in multi-copper enzyme maturation permease subunit
MSIQHRSNSWKIWEWIFAATLIFIAGLLFLFSKQIPVSFQIGIWGLCCIALAFLCRGGWIRLFGPVLFYDLVRTGRRTRNILLRCVYALALLLVLYTVYLEFANSVEMIQANGFPGFGGSRVGVFIGQQMTTNLRNQLLVQALAKFAESFFIMFMEVQFIGVFLLTPAFAAGAIAEEKDRRTLEYLLATDLDNREIVLGKLVSRLLGLALLVLAGLPILSMVQFFGGVDPDLVLGGFAATGLTMVSLAGLSILNSVYTKKPRDAIVLTYLMVAAYLGISGMSRWLIATPRLGPTPIIPENWDDLLEWFSAGNLFVLVHKLREAQAKGMLLTNVLPGLLGNYALVHGLIAILTTTRAVVRLRSVAMRETVVGHRKAPRLLRTWRPIVRGRPMLWKEIILESGLGFNRLGRIVVGLIILASFLPALWIGYHFLSDDQDPVGWNPPSPGFAVFPRMVKPQLGWNRVEEAVNEWVRSVGTIVATLVLLGIGVRAAGAVSGERERQTFDSLLTSPLGAKEILFAKWLGSILSVRWAMLWLCVIWALGAMTGGLDRTCLPWLILCWCVYAAFMAALGLYFSTIYPTTQRSGIWTLTFTGFLFGGHAIFSYFLCFLVPQGLWFFLLGPDSRGAGQPLSPPDLLWHIQWFGLIPPVAMSWMAFRVESFDIGYLQSLVSGRDHAMGAFIGIGIGLVIWICLTLWLWKRTIRRFNILAGRRKIQPIVRRVAPRPKLRPALSSEKSS